jgi:hypothetical protein
MICLQILNCDHETQLISHHLVILIRFPPFRYGPGLLQEIQGSMAKHNLSSHFYLLPFFLLTVILSSKTISVSVVALPSNDVLLAV